MTVQEALQADLMDINVSDNLLTKVLLDNEVTGTDAYSASEDQKKKIDLCRRDIYLYLAAQADYKQGSMAITYSAAQLIAMAFEIEQKYGIDSAKISGESKW